MIFFQDGSAFMREQEVVKIHQFIAFVADIYVGIPVLAYLYRVGKELVNGAGSGGALHLLHETIDLVKCKNLSNNGISQLDRGSKMLTDWLI